MSNWDLIECGFNSADETLNFGTRCFGQSDNLYEATTLATFKNTESENETNLAIKSLNRENKIFMCINKAVRIFENSTSIKLLFNAVLEDEIDTFCVSFDGNYVLVCLRNGVFHFLQVPSGDDEEHVICTGRLDKNAEFGSFFTFCCIEENDNNFTLILVAKCGEITIVSFEKCKLNSSFEFDKENFKVVADISRYESNLTCAAYKYPYLVLSGSALSVYDFKRNILISDEGVAVGKIFPLDIPTFIGLRNDGSLVVICAVTLQVFYLKSFTRFKDIHVFDNIDNEYFLYGVVQSEEGCHIQLCTFPEQEKIFSIKCTGHPILVYPYSAHEDSMYVNQLGKELRLQVISETVPEKRLEKLLKRQKFDEAEAFVKLFKLNPEVILMAKADIFVRKAVCDGNDVDAFLQLLDKINSDEFKYNSIINLTCERVEDLRRILTYGCQCSKKVIVVSRS